MTGRRIYVVGQHGDTACPTGVVVLGNEQTAPISCHFLAVTLLCTLSKILEILAPGPLLLTPLVT